MKTLLAAVSFVLAGAAPAFADGLPVLDASLAKVVSVRVTSEPLGVYNETVRATIEYHAGCVGTTSFVVVRGDMFNMQVYQAVSRPEPGTIPCGAIRIATQEVAVATYYEVTPNPALIKVNGVGITPTSAP
jgi:hypothetical protein